MKKYVKHKETEPGKNRKNETAKKKTRNGNEKRKKNEPEVDGPAHNMDRCE